MPFLKILHKDFCIFSVKYYKLPPTKYLINSFLEFDLKPNNVRIYTGLLTTKDETSDTIVWDLYCLFPYVYDCKLVTFFAKSFNKQVKDCVPSRRLH